MNKVVIFVLFAFNMNAQDTIVFPKIDVFKRNIVEVSYGIPIGELSNKYERSINTGFYVRTKIAEKQFIDFGAELGGIVKGSNILYNTNSGKIILDGTKSSFLLGFRYTRFLYLSKNENFHIESNSGLGWKYLHYSKPKQKEFNEIEINPVLNTVSISQGLKIMYCGFGAHCNYNYAPYGLFNSKVEKNFGASSVNFGISGSWNF
jgi:hypothetical protein